MGPWEIAVVIAAAAIVIGVIATQIVKRHRAKKSGGQVCDGCCDCCPMCHSEEHKTK